MALLDQKQGWQFKHVPVLSGGLNADDDPSVIDETELPNLENLSYEQDILTPVDGFNRFQFDTRVAEDRTSNNNHGILKKGPVWKPTQSIVGSAVRGALDFDGTDDNVTIPNPYGAAQTEATIEGHANLDTIASQQPLASRIFGHATYPRILVNTDGSVTVEANLDAALVTATSAIGLVSADENHHYAVVFDVNATKTMILYLDGNEVASDTTAGTSFDGGSSDLLLGEDVNLAINMDGSLSDWRVWSTARTQAEIQDNDGIRLEGNETGLIGYWPLWGSYIRGTPRRQVQYTRLAGTEELVLITNSTVYRKQGNGWFYTGDGNSTQTDAAASAGDVTISVIDASGFTAAEHIGVELAGGGQHQTTIASVDGPGNNITLDQGLADDINSGADVVQAPNLGGIDEEYVDTEVVFSQDWLAFTNNVDNVKRFDGTNVEDIPNLPASGNTKAKLLSLFGNRLCLLSTTEGGTSRPHRFRWPAKGDPTDWSGPDTGFTDLIDTEDLIVAAEKLANYLIIYKQTSIIRATLVETSTKTFDFPNAVIGEGAGGPGSVAVTEDEHIFIGQNNIYRYAGGSDVIPIGAKVFREYLSSKSNLNRERLDRVIAKYVGTLDEIWFLLVVGSADWPEVILKYDISRPRWILRRISQQINDVAEYSEFGITTYLDLLGSTYLDLSGRTYNSFAAGAGNISVIFTSPGDPINTYQIQDILSKDLGEDIVSFLETRDFGSPHFRSRLDSLTIEGRSSTNVEVHYSLDRGQSWVLMGTFNTSNAWKLSKLYQQIIFDQIRFRFRSTSDASFALKGFGFAFMLESNY